MGGNPGSQTRYFQDISGLSWALALLLLLREEGGKKKNKRLFSFFSKSFLPFGGVVRLSRVIPFLFFSDLLPAQWQAHSGLKIL